jgi:prophage regulatory protein
MRQKPYPVISEVRVLRLPEVMHRVAMRRTKIYSMIQLGQFPAPVRLGARTVGWSSEAITQWIEARIAATRPFSRLVGDAT